MNVMNTYEFEKDAEHAADMTAQNGDAVLARLMKTWESKNAKRAAKGMGLSLMAVSLAACGSDDDSDPVDPVDPIPEPPLALVFDLTPGVDKGEDFTGGEGDDTFNAGLDLWQAFGLIGTVLAPTLGGADEIDGGDGEDTLYAVLNDYFGMRTGNDPRISNIEIIEFEVRDTPSFLGGINTSYVEVNFRNVDGVEQLWMVNSDEGNDLYIYNVQGSTAIGMRNLTDSDYYVDYDDDVLGSAKASQTVVIDNVTDSYLWIETYGDDVITNLTVSVVSSSDVIIDVDSEADGDSTVENLTIVGTGDLELRNTEDFQNLVTLNATGLNGALDIDVKDSDVLETVATGSGDDKVVVAAAHFSEEVDVLVSINLGGGDNTLVLADTIRVSPFGGNTNFNSAEITALDFTLAAITNVQTLEFADRVSLGDEATLSLTGIGGLETVVFDDDFYGNSNDFTLAGPANLTVIAEDGEFEMDGGLLSLEGIVNLTMISTGDGDRGVRIDGGLNGGVLETLVIGAADDAVLTIDLNDPDQAVDALRVISVNAEGDDADLVLVGVPGDVGSPATVESGSFSVTTTTSGGGNPQFLTGNVTIVSSSLPGGSLVIPISIEQNNAGTFSQQGAVAAAIRTALNNVEGIAATGSGSTVSFVWDEAGAKGDLFVSFAPTVGSIVFSAVNTTQGADEVLASDGTGFEALEDVDVSAGGDADVYIEDAYGSFTVNVTAGVEKLGADAVVALIRTGVTSITIDAADYVDLYVEDAADLTSITIIAGDDGNNYLGLSGDMSSLTLIDLSGLTGNDDGGSNPNGYIDVDVSAADFDGGVVTVVIGGSDVDYETGVGNATREVFTFVGEGTGDIQITGFHASVDGTGDRLDFTQMAGINSLDDLDISYAGGMTTITSLVDGVDITITVVGADLSQDAYHFVI